MALPPNIRINTQFPFPALVTGSAPIAIGKASGIWRVSLNVGGLGAIVPLVANFATTYLLVYDSIAGTYSKVALSFFGVGGVRNQRFVTAVPVINALDQIITMAIAAGTPNVALPASATRNGVPLTFKDLGQAFAHNITLTPNGAETIDGLANKQMKTNYQAVTLVPFNDGTNSGWFTT